MRSIFRRLVLPFALLVPTIGCDRGEDEADRRPAPVEIQTTAGQESTATHDTSRHANTGNPANSRGPADALVTIIEYSDFECPFSRRMAPHIAAIVERYPTEVRWVFKSFPLPFHPNARLAHEAALAAGEFDLFWEMHDKILAAQGSLSPDTLVELAVSLGIPEGEFRDLLDSRYFADRVEAELAEGRWHGVRGTPTILLGGRLLAGVQSPDVLDYLIRKALGRPADLPTGASPDLILGDPEPKHALAFGELDASPLLKIFVDFRSPLGKQTLVPLDAIFDRHGRDARIIIKSRPTGIYPDASLFHQAVIAFQMRGVDFRSVWRRGLANRRRLDVDAIARWAIEFGLGADVEQEIRAELRAETHRGTVDDDLRQAKRLGISGSPTAVIFGARLDGVEGLRKLLTALDERQKNASPGLGQDVEYAELVVSDVAQCDVHGEAPASDTATSRDAAQGLTFVHDFGTVARGAGVRHEFSLPNSGNEVLKLTKLYAPPSVAINGLSGEIAPGEKRIIEVNVRTSAVGDVALPVILARTVEIENASSRTYARLLLRGHVTDDVRVTPAGGLHVRSQRGEIAAATATITFGKSSVISPKIARRTPENLEARIEKIDASNYLLRVRVPTADRPLGKHAGWVVVTTNHSEVREIHIPIEILVHEEIIVTPRTIELKGSAKLEGATERGGRIHLRAANGDLLAIRRVTSTVPGVRVIPDQTPMEAEHKLLVDLKSAPAGSQGEIVITVSVARDVGARTVEVRIPVR